MSKHHKGFENAIRVGSVNGAAVYIGDKNKVAIKSGHVTDVYVYAIGLPTERYRKTTHQFVVEILQTLPAFKLRSR